MVQRSATASRNGRKEEDLYRRWKKEIKEERKRELSRIVPQTHRQEVSEKQSA